MENIIERTIPVVEIDEPNMGYEYNEFQVRKDPITGILYAGRDGGCSCYEGFNPANFEACDSVGRVRVLFHQWIGEWHDGSGHEAAAWEQFHEAVH